MKNTDQQLLDVLDKLELSAQKIVETRGYTKEVEKIKVLQETIREQITNENSRSATRSNR